ncbi:electron carrier/ protein disulfide oxidoreductase [Anaeramoeba flamelloides]|uniref:Electron carrier/ protein disulfide oxidoreductase n=1 Tax=Anaeramoeba flamelloides TaxID=1746091 RepID=A0ABQ8XXG3_9EUKA|nr:electron carrier/ protein disulfide oxidoreductase [Anaeramoeba flamelloides]
MSFFWKTNELTTPTKLTGKDTLYEFENKLSTLKLQEIKLKNQLKKFTSEQYLKTLNKKYVTLEEEFEELTKESKTLTQLLEESQIQLKKEKEIEKRELKQGMDEEQKRTFFNLNVGINKLKTHLLTLKKMLERTSLKQRIKEVKTELATIQNEITQLRETKKELDLQVSKSIKDFQIQVVNHVKNDPRSQSLYDQIINDNNEKIETLSHQLKKDQFELKNLRKIDESHSNFIMKERLRMVNQQFKDKQLERKQLLLEFEDLKSFIYTEESETTDLFSEESEKDVFSYNSMKENFSSQNISLQKKLIKNPQQKKQISNNNDHEKNENKKLSNEIEKEIENENENDKENENENEKKNNTEIKLGQEDSTKDGKENEMKTSVDQKNDSNNQNLEEIQKNINKEEIHRDKNVEKEGEVETEIDTDTDVEIDTDTATDTGTEAKIKTKIENDNNKEIEKDEENNLAKKENDKKNQVPEQEIESEIEKEEKKESNEKTTNYLLNKRNILPYFHQYLSNTIIRDYVHLFFSIYDFKQLEESHKKFALIAKRIYKKYLLPGSLFEIEVPIEMEQKINTKVEEKNFSSDMYDQLFKITKEKINQISLVEFQQSQIFLNFLNSQEGDKKTHNDKENNNNNNNINHKNRNNITLIPKKDTERALNNEFSFMENSRTPYKVAKQLMEVLISILNSNFSISSLQIDLNKIKSSIQFHRFVAATTELQKVELNFSSDNKKKAFWLNLYNIILLHAAISNGLPKKRGELKQMYQKSYYIIGGMEFSLQDIHCGILRANKDIKHNPYFQKENDPRAQYAFEKIDPRIHFCLISLTSGVSIIQVYYSKGIEKILQRVTKIQLTKEIKIQKHKILLPRKIQEYSKDFANNLSEVLYWLYPFLENGKFSKIKIEEKHTIKFLKESILIPRFIIDTKSLMEKKFDKK